MEKTRKSSDITDVNALGMYEFHVGEIEKGLIYPYPTLRLYGHRGYPDYFVHIRFRETVYISCAPSFNNCFIWRVATKEEAEKVYVIAGEDDKAEEYRAKVYCIEEDMSLYRTPLEREVRKFFIVAWGIEVTLEYDEVLEDRVTNWGKPA
ncbi:MAG: hypothetical protein ACRDIV_17075 [Ktedonobacteraceae bacterium]